LTKRSRLSNIRESAGMRSPALRSTTSPGTNWSIDTECLVPSRRTVAPDCHRPAQRLYRILRPDLLDEIQRYADCDDGGHDDETSDVAGRRGQSTRHQQDDDQRATKARQELQPKWRAFDGAAVLGPYLVSRAGTSTVARPEFVVASRLRSPRFPRGSTRPLWDSGAIAR
jgi:hypothetical protein